jgi:endothelin-converting enzyme/putative endopeptidase
MRKLSLCLAVLPLALVACPSKDAVVDVKSSPMPSGSAAPSASAAAARPAPPALGGLAPEEEAALDRSVNPCDDFFQFACGGWIRSTPIPDDEDKWVRSFSTIKEKNETLLRTILESYSRGEPAKLNGREFTQPEAKMLGDFYASCMDEKGIEDAGVAPLKTDLAMIDGIKDKNGLVHAIASMQARGMVPVFAVGEQQDFKDATKVIGAIEQAGLGMPEREYYLKKDDAAEKLRQAYVAHVTAMFTLLGEKPDQAKKSAETVMKIETALADASMTKEDRRDPKKTYHLMATADLPKEFPGVAWDRYEKDVGATTVKEWNVAQTTYLAAASDMVNGKVPVAEWKPYLKWHLVRATSAALPKRFVDEAFAWQKTLRGTAKIPDRWKRCVRAADGEIGHALAKAFVALTLGDEGKAQVKEQIGLIEAQMGEDLDHLSWMDGDTRGRAKQKLVKIANKVAYPDVWRSYDGLKIERGHHFDNVLRADAFEMKRELAKIGKPVDKNEWQMTPPTVNAYYDPSMNEMVFPAGILQPPFFSTKQEVPTNFGGIGMVMGHELTHGFDDQGRQFDGDGNLKDWWTPAVGAEFDKRASCVEKQFSSYTVLGDPNAKVNGKLTLGENIADLGGVKLAFYAMKNRIKSNPPPAQSNAATPEQRFFLGFAQGWCGSYREPALRHLIATNPHSPPQYRVDGPLSNFKEFQTAFQCSDDAKMVRKDSCEIW